MSNKPRYPNLFIVGAMKAGTTSLHNYLNTHPDIFMSHPKEPSYFVPRELLKVIYPDMEKRGFWRGEESYLALFNDAGNATVIGESSTNYSKRPLIDGIPAKIHDFCAEAKIIYIMRDPIERTISHYWHMVALHSESRGLLQAIMTDPHYIETSYYAMQLRPYFDLFGRGNVATLTFENLKTNAREELCKLFLWLGVPDLSEELDSSVIRRSHNVTPEQLVRVSGKGYLRRLRNSTFWSKIGPHIPRRVRAVGRGLSEKKIHRSDVSRKEVVEFLRPLQLVQTEELGRLLNRDFAEWNTLYR